MLFAVVAVAVFAVDRVTKGMVVANLAPGTAVGAGPGVQIVNAHNSGAAFSLAPNATLVFLVASVVVAGGLLYYAVRNPLGAALGGTLGLVMGGALGNGYDRLIHGTVTDFIAVFFWPVFNVADSAITLGVILLLLGYLRRQRGA